MRLQMRKTNLATGIILLIICTFFPFLTMARTQLDTSFGDAGVSLQDFKLGDDEAHAIAVQADGKILVAGYKSDGAAKKLIVSRFSKDGSLDTTFNNTGSFSSNLWSGDTIGRSLAIQKDDKIIIGISTYDEGAKVAVLRLTATGSPDPDFAEDGYLVLPVDEGEIASTAIQLTPDGDIVLAATVTPEPSVSYAFFAKINSAGRLDDTFSEDGQFSYKDGSNNIVINTITVLSDDSNDKTVYEFLAGGSFTEGTVPQAGLLKINTDGSIDTTYATDGKASFPLGITSSVIHSSALDSDGNVIIAGAINDGDYDESFVAKIKDDGSADTDFASSGIYRTTYSLGNIIYSVSLQPDDSISAVGFITTPTGKDIFVLSLEEQAETQTTAITYIVTDIAKSDDVAYAAVIDLESDRLLAAGSSSNGGDLDVALLRFADGTTLSSATPTSSVNVNGVTTSGFRITTHPVTTITRVGAMTGGTIVDTTPGTCAERCTSQCQDDTDCFSACTETCEDGVTITRRGVVYGTDPNPEYAPDDTEEDQTGSETTTTASDTETNSDTDTTSSSGSIFQDSDSSGSIFPESVTYYIVRLGNTDDGEGEGQYTTGISNMTPGTRYYLRAYAVLSNGEVIYGNEYTLETDDACFIATAAYGSILDKHVVLLRQFRDSYLLTNNIGQRFVALYYHFSPPIADSIRGNTILQTIVRIALFPAVLFALFFVKTALLTKLICLAIGLPGIFLLIFRYFTSHQVTTT